MDVYLKEQWYVFTALLSHPLRCLRFHSAHTRVPSFTRIPLKEAKITVVRVLKSKVQNLVISYEYDYKTTA